MRCRLLLLVVVMLALPGAKAYAGTIVTGDQAAKWQAYVAESRVPTPDVTIQVVVSPGGCPDYPDRNCTHLGSTVIYLTESASRGDFYDELGHEFDYWVLTDPERSVFLALMGETDRVWRDPPNSPHEQFAVAYELAALGPGQPTFGGKMMGGFEYNPAVPVHRQIATDIRLWGGLPATTKSKSPGSLR